MNKIYNDFNYELVDKVVGEMLDDGDGGCGLNEIVGLVCGEEYYNNYDKEDLDYVEEVMNWLFRIKVEFDLDNECMWDDGDYEDEA